MSAALGGMGRRAERTAPRARWTTLAGSVVVACAALTTGCAPATFNVRAQRAFSNEEAVTEVVTDRATDVRAARAVAMRLLEKVPYAPADEWIANLALQGEVAKRVKTEIESKPPYQGGEHEIPAAKVFRVHLEKVEQGALAPRKNAPMYPSVLDALATVSPSSKDLKAQFLAYDAAVNDLAEATFAQQKVVEDLRHRNVPMPPSVPADPPALVQAKQRTGVADGKVRAAEAALMPSIEGLAAASTADPVRDRIVKDSLEVLSVVLRTTLETRALIPIVEKQAARSISFAQRDLFVAERGKEAERLGLGDVPGRMLGSEAMLAHDEALLERTNVVLSGNVRVPREKTAGFLYKESIVDQVVGVNWDSFRAHAKLDGEVVFFNQVGTKGVSGDYTGRTRRLAYDVKPVAMVGGRVQLAFDWLHLQNAATLGGAFTTDRIFGVNGNIENSGSLGQQLGLTGLASDVLDIGAGLVGIRTRLKNATFTNGEVTEIAVDPVTGQDTGTIAKAPLQLSYTQLDVGYDVAFLLSPETVGKLWIEEVLVGFRYMSYRLPRVLYELQDVNPPGSENQNFKFARESLTQRVSTQSYLGGGTFRFGQGEGRMISLFGDVGIYGGAGPTKYALTGGQTENPAALLINGSLGLGARIRLTPRKLRLRVLLEMQYHGEAIYQTILSGLRATQTADGTTYQVDKKVDFGGLDIFHGPRIQIVGVF